MAKAIKEKENVAGIGIAGKDFDNTVHMFLDVLYSNGGTFLNADTGEATLDSQQTRKTLQMYKDILPYAEEGPTAWERNQMKDLFNDQKLAQALSSGAAQYDLDSVWGLTPIFQYEKLGTEKPNYMDDPFWRIFVDGISTGGPEPLVTDFKSLARPVHHDDSRRPAVRRRVG